MHWLQRLAVLCLAGVVSLAIGLPAQAQQKAKFEKVHILTVDGVDLNGCFYPSKKRNPATVLLLHALGEDSRKKNWVNLAEELQEKEFAVLTFDFRGHGNSTSISEQEKFWKQPNLTYIKSKNREQIEFKDIATNYYTVFCNDVAAARAWLDRKNDTGAVNTSNLIVIGAETGATVGALWLHSEWMRVKLNNIQMGMGVFQMPDTRQEGKDVIAAIWLSITPKLGAVPIPVKAVLDTPARRFGTPMVFMYGDGDLKGKDYAKALANGIKSGKDKQKFPFTDAVVIPGTKLTGQGLLSKELETDKHIVGYLNQVLEDRSREWFERDSRKTEYVWMLPGNPKGVPARLKGGGDPNNLNFDTYTKFIPR